MGTAEILLQTADVLEKTAAYLEALETERMGVEKAARAKVATDLATRLSATLGEPVSQDIVEKLAGQGPEVQALLDRLAGSGSVDSLGGPPESTGNSKTASSGGSLADSDRRFIEWCVGQ